MYVALSNFMLPRRLCRELEHPREVLTGDILKLSPEGAKELLKGGYIKAVKEEPEKPKTEPKKGKG